LVQVQEEEQRSAIADLFIFYPYNQDAPKRGNS
jgi:hypothetical protein